MATEMSALTNEENADNSMFHLSKFSEGSLAKKKRDILRKFSLLK